MLSRKLLPWHLAALLVFIALKVGLQNAAPETLAFLLKPVAGLLMLFTNANAIWLPGKGYSFPEWNIVIDSSCAGVSFWALSFGMLHMVFAQRGLYQKRGFKAFFTALAGSYLLTIPANAMRIYLSLFLREKASLLWSQPDLSMLHQRTGIAVQVTLLSLLYLGLNRFVRSERKHPETASE